VCIQDGIEDSRWNSTCSGFSSEMRTAAMLKTVFLTTDGCKLRLSDFQLHDVHISSYETCQIIRKSPRKANATAERWYNGPQYLSFLPSNNVIVMVLREIVVAPRVPSTPCLQVNIIPVGGSANSGLYIVTYHNFHGNPTIKSDRNLGYVFLSSGLEIREYDHRDPSRWPRGTLYPQKLSLTSPTSGGRSVGILRSRTQAMEFSFFNFFRHRFLLRGCQWTKRAIVTSKCDNEQICLRNLHIDRRMWFEHILNSTILRVVRGDIKGTQCPGVYKYGNLTLQVGGVSNETVKYGLEFCGTSTQEWLLWQGPESFIQWITDPSSRQRGRYKITNTQMSEGNFKEKEKLVKSPRWAPDTKTDWPTDCRS
jgi:hypothetical protein